MSTYYVTSAGAGNAGGSNWANAMPWATMLTTVTAGDIAYVSGSISRTTSTDAFTNVGTPTAPIQIIGCSTASDTDGYQGRTNGFGALVTTNFAAITYTSGRLNPGKAYLWLQNISISCSGYGGAAFTSSGNSVLDSCVIVNSYNNSGATGVTSGAQDRIINCDLSATGASSSTAIYMSGAGAVVYGCRITAVGGTAVLHGDTRVGCVCVNCCIYNSSIGTRPAGTTGTSCWSFINCTFYSCTTTYSGPNGNMSPIEAFINCSVTDSGTVAWANGYASGLALLRWGCRMRDNPATADSESGGGFAGWPSVHSVTTDTGNYTYDYVDAPNGDFRLVAASPAAKAGLPTGDIGAVTRAAPAVADVLSSDTVYGGTYHAPDAAEVWHTAVFGPASGTSGTKTASTITNCSAENVKKDVAIDDVTGTYEAAGGGVDLPEPLRIGA